MDIVNITAIVAVVAALFAFIYRSIRYYKVLNKRKLLIDTVFIVVIFILMGLLIIIDKGFIEVPDYCAVICATLAIVLFVGYTFMYIKTHKKQK